MQQELSPTSQPYANVPLETDVRTPRDVLDHPTMSNEAKRTVLASWASDRHAVPSFPGVRRLEDGRLVSLAEILQALRALDGPSEPSQENVSSNLISLAEQRRQHRLKHWTRMRSPHDDDPPPRPAAASFPATYSRVSAVATLAAEERAWRHVV